tara:strand:- start:4449 stop:5786 length:1338 start_codon:yes stop_codon:yes gene_type:complete
LDFLKIIVFDKDEVQNIWNHPDLVWYDHQERLSHIDYQTIIVKETKEFNKVLFCKHKRKLEILFSVHRFYNDNLHNANDFKVIDCIGVLRDFFTKFGLLTMQSVKLVGLEYGINFRMGSYAPKIIQHTEYWKRTKFLADDELGYSKKSFTIKNNGRANGYKIIKWYSKGVQFPKYCHKDTIRLEIKTRQAQYLKKIGITAINDLLKLEVYYEMKEEILLTASEILILDQTIEKKSLTESERDYLNPYTWINFINGYRNQFNREKEKYFEFLNKIGQNVHTTIRNKINEKVSELFENYLEIGADLPPQNLASISTAKGADLPVCIKQVCTFTDLSKYRCKVTGLILENEGPIKEGERVPNYIRSKTLRYLQINDPHTFERLRMDLIPNNKHSRPKFERSLITHMCKQLRNRFHNSIRIKQKGYNKPKPKFNEQLNLYQAFGLEHAS